jgi:hypothetical protein
MTIWGEVAEAFSYSKTNVGEFAFNLRPIFFCVAVVPSL